MPANKCIVISLSLYHYHLVWQAGLYFHLHTFNIELLYFTYEFIVERKSISLTVYIREEVDRYGNGVRADIKWTHVTCIALQKFRSGRIKDMQPVK